MKFSETLYQLRQISGHLREQGVTVEKLDNAIDELSQHHDNIEKIEENISAIRAEVVAPLEKELQQNRVAGRFSIFGFWVGALGIVVSIGSLLYQGSRQVSDLQNHATLSGPSAESTDVCNKTSIANEEQFAILSDQVRQISDQLLFPSSMVLKEGELFAQWLQKTELSMGGAPSIEIYVYSVSDSMPNGLLAGLQFFRDGRLLGVSAIEAGYLQSGGGSELREWHNNEVLAVGVGDVIKIGGFTLEVAAVYSENAFHRVVGDEKTGVKIRVSRESGGI